MFNSYNPMVNEEREEVQWHFILSTFHNFVRLSLQRKVLEHFSFFSFARKRTINMPICNLTLNHCGTSF